MGRALSLGLAHDLAIEAPYAQIEKAEVIRRGAVLGVPFELTLSCMSPAVGIAGQPLPRHCGTCSKCRERHDAFVDAGIKDPDQLRKCAIHAGVTRVASGPWFFVPGSRSVLRPWSLSRPAVPGPVLRCMDKRRGTVDGSCTENGPRTKAQGPGTGEDYS